MEEEEEDGGGGGWRSRRMEEEDTLSLDFAIALVIIIIMSPSDYTVQTRAKALKYLSLDNSDLPWQTDYKKNPCPGILTRKK